MKYTPAKTTELLNGIEFDTKHPGSKLADLPVEILLLIFKFIHQDSMVAQARVIPRGSEDHPFKKLRLVSRKFSQILRDEIFKSVTIRCSDSARGFFEWYTNIATNQGGNLRISRLSISNVVRTSDHQGIILYDQTIGYDIFQDILSTLAPSLLQLRIEFLENFEFSENVIQSFSRAKFLKVLHLQVLKYSSRSLVSKNILKDSSRSHHNTPTITRTLYNVKPLLRAIESLQNLKELDLNSCLDFCNPLPTSENVGLLGITHLSLSLAAGTTSFANSQHLTLLKLCKSVIKTLKILEIKGFRYNPAKVAPVLSVVRNDIEALRISELTLLQLCNGVEFSKLQIIAIDDSRYLRQEDFEVPMFQKVKTLILRTCNLGESPLEIPVERLPNLKRIILLSNTRRPTTENLQLFKTCKDFNVELLYTFGSIDLRHVNLIEVTSSYIR
ncbi:hypothetical protein BY996DRAFT_1542353 [Phakopsora pachyrhizi]|nr:hypothetical protein BY996DRAFT_1542353 [Phakopsora pachyrhizi]